VRDTWGNEAAATTLVSAKQDDTVLASAIAGNAWVAPGPGTYTLTASATPTGGGMALAHSVTFVVVAAQDTSGPTITFRRPAGDPTIASVPAPGQVVPNGCPGGDGDLIGVTLSDASNVSQYWLTYGGLIDGQPAPELLPTLSSPVPSL